MIRGEREGIEEDEGYYVNDGEERKAVWREGEEGGRETAWRREREKEGKRDIGMITLAIGR